MPRKEYDYSELLGLIKQKCGTQEVFANILGISVVSLSDRLANRLPFKQDEMRIAKEFFNLDAEGFDRVFYTLKLRKTV